MIDRAFEITTKMIVGEDISEDDKKYLRERNRKYELVRFLVMDHSKQNGGPELSNFHFTPGDDFDNTSALDIANEIVNLWGPHKTFSFGDYSLRKSVD